MGGILDHERRAAAGMAAILAGISTDQRSARTPCPEWTVWDLVAHVVAANVKYTEIGKGADWARGAPPVELDDDPPAMYRRTHESLLQAWQSPGALDRDVTLPVGRGRAENALFIHLGDTLVHGWDLAVATGLRARFDDDVVEASLAHYQSWLPPQRSADAPFSDAEPVDDDAPPIDRLAAYLGRPVATWAR